METINEESLSPHLDDPNVDDLDEAEEEEEISPVAAPAGVDAAQNGADEGDAAAGKDVAPAADPRSSEGEIIWFGCTMSKGDSEVPLYRHALGDVTNLLRKRDASSVTGKFVNGNLHFGTLAGDGGLLKKSKTCEPLNADSKGKGLDFLSLAPPGKYAIPGPLGGISQENARHTASYKETEKLDTLGLLSSNALGHMSTEADGSRGSCFSFGSAPSQSNISDDTSLESEESQEDCVDGSCFTGQVVQMENSYEIFSTLGEPNVGGRESSGPSGLCNFETAGIEGFHNSHATLVSNKATVEDITGSGKACSCSLCLKAAYMWTDLHYQDTRGRLAALKKSRRHARSLEGKFHGQDPSAKSSRDYPRKSVELEFDLMQRCRSLFLHTEDALVRETAQLHTNLLRLKEMREKCKRDLEKMSNKS